MFLCYRQRALLIIVHHIADDSDPGSPKANPQKAAVKKGTAVVKKKATAATKKGTAVVVKKRTRAIETEDSSDDGSQIRLGRKRARKGPPKRIMLDDGSENGDGSLPNDEGEV